MALAITVAFVSCSSSFVSGATTTMEDWDNLSSKLSSSSALQAPADINAWFDQCIRPFDVIEDEDGVLTSVSMAGAGVVPNARLFDQPSGLCMQAASCAFTDCRGVFYDTYGEYIGFWASETYPAYPEYPIVTSQAVMDAAAGGNSQLPEAVVHPLHPGDVVAAVRFAKEHGMGISVKTSGHNWMGSSTRKGTLLIHLSKLQKYALPETPEAAIVECASSSSPSMTDAMKAACKLATARGKPAVIRFGGGQIVDEGLKTLEAWNNVTGQDPYHAMIGAAGTVSAVGGWLASGGLGGTLGHRMYGVGVDQVLHVEMVLPDGRFVRFGPSDWTMPQGDQLYPQTTEVTGFCNDATDLGDEASWNWVPCDNPPNFADLWFAIRGGGGGNYGVLTSVYYQLHPKTKFEVIFTQEDETGAVTRLLADPNLSDEVKVATLGRFQEFLFTFLYNPSKIGVPVSVSNGCSSPDIFILFCYNGSGQALADAWEQYDSTGAMPLTVQEYDSYPVFMNAFATEVLGFPDDLYGGRVPDFPLGQTVFLAPNPIVFPIDVLAGKMDEFLELWIPCYVKTIVGVEGCMANAGQPYIYGGGTQFGSDGMDAFPSHRRNGGIHIGISNETVKEDFKKLFGLADAQEDSEVFPGIYCHNHLWNTTAPRKSNWLKECKSLEEGDAVLGEGDCMSVQEAAFGTTNLRRLERIHAEIDPNRMFHTSDGPGYADIDVSGGEGDDSEEGSKPESAGMSPSCATAWSGALIFLLLTVVNGGLTTYEGN